MFDAAENRARLRPIRALYSSAEADMAGKKKAIAELEALLPKLDEAGVAFLLEQAQVLLHNREVDQLQRNEASKEDKARSPSARGAKGQTETGFRVERADDGETYHLVSGGLWKMFTAGEMAAMVAIARGDSGESEAARRLHVWLERERRDALADFSLGMESGPATRELVRALKAAFSGRK